MGISLSTVILCIQLATIVSSSSIGDLAGPVVDLGYAQYKGSINVSTNITSFLGIQYATPPTGKQMLYLQLQ
jgi:hypothetical protein